MIETYKDQINPERMCDCGHPSTTWIRCVCNRVVCRDCFRSTKSKKSKDGKDVIEAGDAYCIKCRPPKPKARPKSRPTKTSASEESLF